LKKDAESYWFPLMLFQHEMIFFSVLGWLAMGDTSSSSG
jgi:hypothetical protein